MVYRNFIFNVFIRIFLIILMCCLIAYFFFVNIDYIKFSFSIFVVLLLSVDLIRYVNKSNKDFSNFIALLKHNDFSTHFSRSYKGGTFKNLYEDLNDLSKKYQNLSIENELKHRHLQTVLEHIDVGIISYDSSESIQIINTAFKKLLQTPHLSSHHSINKLDKKFVKAVRSIKVGKNSLIKIKVDGRELHLALQASIYKLREEEFKLISAKNIISELEEKELESYQKLIRVLTHEIMNSITPIASLSNTLNSLLKQNGREKNSELAQQVKIGIEAICDRSRNLLLFTENYRKLTRLPQPEFKKINMDEFIRNVYTIIKAIPGADSIKIVKHMENDLTFKADPKLLEQVFINIYKNAIEALAFVKDAKIEMKASLNRNNRLQVQISDNGPGMKKAIREKVFIPFYTTKREGSGIGLSLCRQIILAHHGHIKLDSEEGKGTQITIYI